MDDKSAGRAGKPLHVLIAGAGIGGLTAAIALRQQGHDVEVFEQSKLASETGAAIHIVSNCNSLLRRLGLNVEDIGAVECKGVTEYRPDGGLNYSLDLDKVPNIWTHKWNLAHRAHLHTALKRIATQSEGIGAPVRLHVGAVVRSVDPETATLKLEDGTEVHGDLLVGADGVHSRTRASIPGGDLQPFDSGKSAFRFLIPTEVLAADPQTADLVRNLDMKMWIGEDKRLVHYPCVNGTMFNYVAIHPSKESETDITGEGWGETGSKARMLQIYDSFEPAVQAILGKADESKLKVWKLLDMDKMPSFVHERLAVIGDAAHPFLPHQGQGGAQAIEDGAALAALLPLGTTTDDIAERLKLYEECRYERSHNIQDFTRNAGKDASELAAQGKKLNMMQYQQYNLGHDAWDHATNVLQKHLAARDKSSRFRSPYGFGPSPGPRRPLNMAATDAKITDLRKKSPESSTTYSIRFKSSRTYLQNLLPPGFAFTSPGTLASASVVCTTLDGMTWLGGGGYSHCGLYLHGVNYTKRDGSKTYGTYLPVLFEDLTDPIITGRAEVGFPKLFANITSAPNSTDGVDISLNWRGTTFVKIELQSLTKKEAMINGTSHAPPPKAGPGPPPPPPEEGLLVYRYVPAVGQPGKADAEYAVLAPHPEPSHELPQPDVVIAESASVKFEAGDWHSLPTLHHIAKTLAGIPMYGVEEAKRSTRSGYVDDLSTAHRLD